MRTCNWSNCEHEDEYNALSAENEVLRAKLFAYVAIFGLLEDTPPSTDRPDLRAKFLGAFDNVIPQNPLFKGGSGRWGPCTAHDAFSTACLEDGDQYLEPEGK